jgi:hypothetical protein
MMTRRKLLKLISLSPLALLVRNTEGGISGDSNILEEPFTVEKLERVLIKSHNMGHSEHRDRLWKTLNGIQQEEIAKSNTFWAACTKKRTSWG